MSPIKFIVIAKDKNSRARAGIIYTQNGRIETPYLVPVATCAAVRSLDSQDLFRLGVQAVLANTYHLYCQPGSELIETLGGLHKFMNWSKPIFTDSGGYQAFSLGTGTEIGIRKIGHFPKSENIPKKSDDTENKNTEKRKAIITEKGIRFQSIYDKSYKFLTPELSMKIQSALSSDIIMALDECTSPSDSYKYVKESTERTHRWALESLHYHNPKQALYGIIQGSNFKDLRDYSTKFIASQPFDGIAIGGSLGDGKPAIHEILGWIMPHLDNDSRPKHLLGIGWIDDLFECIERGIDTFDCVQMTRIARHGDLYVSPPEGSLENKFRIEIDKTEYKEDSMPIDSTCSCSTCKNYSRAYLHHLYKARELSYSRLATIHNLHFALNLTSKIRQSIIEGNGAFQKLKNYWLG